MIEPIHVIICLLIGCIVLFVGASIYQSRTGWRYRAKYLGHDPTYTKTRRYDVKQYIVTHLDGSKSVVYAHVKETDGAFAKFYVADTTTWNRLTVDPHDDYVGKPWGGYRGYTLVRELDSIKEIESETVGEETYVLQLDRRHRSTDCTVENPIIDTER